MTTATLGKLRLTSCEDEACISLRQRIEDGASQADDTRDLATAFLILKHIVPASDLNELNTHNIFAHTLLNDLGAPYSTYLRSKHDELNFIELNKSEAEQNLLRLMLKGVSNESPVFVEHQIAHQFVSDLMTWFGEPCRYLTNKQGDKGRSKSVNEHYQTVSLTSGFSVFEVGNCSDEGIIFVTPRRTGLLWFLGYD